jgi:tetratricopeptide repeat protein
MRSRGTLLLAGLLLFLAAIVINACYNAPPPPPEIPATPEATPPPPESEQEPEESEAPPAWPVGRLAEQDISPEPTSTPTPTDTPTATDTPFGQTPAPTDTPTPTPTDSPTPTPTPEPTPQVDFSQDLPQGQLSDQPLGGEINPAMPPTRRTALRIADKARVQLRQHHPDEAIRTLGRALSIDAANPYVYFYLGRAYLMKHNYQQALTFWARAAISFGDNPKWLAEALTFEAATKERLGELTQARRDYKRACKLAPDNALARDGCNRLVPPPPPAPKAEPEEAEPSEPGSEPSEASPPPAEAAPPPAEAEPAPADQPPENDH